jgi:hypothetical protein
MANTAYSGALARAAHFAMRPPVPGVSADHGPQPDTTVEPDPFSPQPDTPSGQAHDVWQPQDQLGHTEYVPQPITHWADLQPPLPLNTKTEYVHTVAQQRLIQNHSVIDYRMDPSRYYKNATQGMSIEFIEGPAPALAGVEAPEFLVAGKNSFDFTNQPNEVYSGGRYRLGTEIREHGLYQFWTKQGQDAQLRAYTGLSPQVPVDKPRVPDSAPYTPNSSGTTTWVQPSFNVPSMFSTPSETAATDFAVANGDVVSGSSDFSEGERL